jgi:adenylate cyclase class 2
MKMEIEVKFLDVDFNDVRARLEELSGVCEQPMRLMRRALIQTDAMIKNGRHSFMRLRDEGDKVTLTFKEFKENSLTGASEHEVVVSDFETTLAILEEGGLKHQSLQESKRETWRVGDGVEVVLDEWPWLSPYIEIEAHSEELVKDMATKLGFSWDDAVFGSVTEAFQIQYPNARNPRGLIDLPEVKFGAPLPDIFKPHDDEER